MSERNGLITDFLAQSGWGDAIRAPLAGDASNRRYERLTLRSSKAVLMDAPPEKGEDIRPFVRIAERLAKAGLSAPEIYAQDVTFGLLLLEDFGDDLFAKLLKADPDQEELLYKAATDVLIQLHKAPTPTDLAPYDAPFMAEMAALAWRWYALGAERFDEGKTVSIQAKIQEFLATLPDLTTVLIQRDYHAENMIWLPDRTAEKRVGLLDFQDAMAGHRAYDLVSMLQDARRDVSPEIERQMIDHYVSQTEVDPTDFDRAYHALGMQRNLRIIGVFARLSMHFGKPHYVDFIPRVWGLLQRDLDHPALADIAPLIRENLPEPTPDHLQMLKDKCATIPHL